MSLQRCLCCQGSKQGDLEVRVFCELQKLKNAVKHCYVQWIDTGVPPPLPSSHRGLHTTAQELLRAGPRRFAPALVAPPCQPRPGYLVIYTPIPGKSRALFAAMEDRGRAGLSRAGLQRRGGCGKPPLRAVTKIRCSPGGEGTSKRGVGWAAHAAPACWPAARGAARGGRRREACGGGRGRPASAGQARPPLRASEGGPGAAAGPKIVGRQRDVSAVCMLRVGRGLGRPTRAPLTGVWGLQGAGIKTLRARPAGWIPTAGPPGAARGGARARALPARAGAPVAEERGSRARARGGEAPRRGAGNFGSLNARGSGPADPWMGSGPEAAGPGGKMRGSGPPANHGPRRRGRQGRGAGEGAGRGCRAAAARRPPAGRRGRRPRRRGEAVCGVRYRKRACAMHAGKRGAGRPLGEGGAAACSCCGLPHAVFGAGGPRKNRFWARGLRKESGEGLRKRGPRALEKPAAARARAARAPCCAVGGGGGVRRGGGKGRQVPGRAGRARASGHGPPQQGRAAGAAAGRANGPLFAPLGARARCGRGRARGEPRPGPRPTGRACGGCYRIERALIERGCVRLLPGGAAAVPKRRRRPKGGSQGPPEAARQGGLRGSCARVGRRGGRGRAPAAPPRAALGPRRRRPKRGPGAPAPRGHR